MGRFKRKTATFTSKMKSMMPKLAMTPRDIRMNVENESKTHKMKVAGFAVLMAAISGAYQNYYDMQSWRVGQLQSKYLAGEAGYGPPTLRHSWDQTQFDDKNTLNHLESHSFKELVQEQKGWNTVVRGTGYSSELRTPREDAYEASSYTQGWYVQSERWYSHYDGPASCETIS